MNKGGFSWKRATGISAVKSKISRATGIPMSKSGRQQKIGRMVTGKGCLAVIVMWFSLSVFFVWLIVRLIHAA